MSLKSDSNLKRPRTADKSRDLGSNIFLGFLGVIACLYAVILFYHTSKPPGVVAEDDGVLEQCRQICMKYGLVSTGDVHKDAENYLEAVQSHKLTEGLSVILADNSFKAAESESISLLDQSAPEFSLPDDGKTTRKLSELGKDRPVVVVFYLGYGCSHCVAQLLALDKDLHYFRELDAEIVAISSDSPEHTAEKLAEYGRFKFPVLADIDYAVSQKWGVYQPETDDKSEFMNHGTFVVARNGEVIWGAMGTEPFLDNKTLLHVIAKSQGLMPSQSAADSVNPASFTVAQ
jgi:peroxiredoxin Q/BCP